MPKSCCVPSCTKFRRLDTSFFKFPENEELAAEWREAIREHCGYLKLPKYPVICTWHFRLGTDYDIVGTGDRLKPLRRCLAVPSIFPPLPPTMGARPRKKRMVFSDSRQPVYERFRGSREARIKQQLTEFGIDVTPVEVRPVRETPRRPRQTRIKQKPIERSEPTRVDIDVMPVETKIEEVKEEQDSLSWTYDWRPASESHEPGVEGSLAGSSDVSVPVGGHERHGEDHCPNLAHGRSTKRHGSVVVGGTEPEVIGTVQDESDAPNSSVGSLGRLRVVPLSKLIEVSNESHRLGHAADMAEHVEETTCGEGASDVTAVAGRWLGGQQRYQSWTRQEIHETNDVIVVDSFSEDVQEVECGDVGGRGAFQPAQRPHTAPSGQLMLRVVASRDGCMTVRASRPEDITLEEEVTYEDYLEYVAPELDEPRKKSRPSRRTREPQETSFSHDHGSYCVMSARVRGIMDDLDAAKKKNQDLSRLLTSEKTKSKRLKARLEKMQATMKELRQKLKASKGKK